MKKYALIGIALGLALLLGLALYLRSEPVAHGIKLPPGSDFVLQSADESKSVGGSHQGATQDDGQA